VANFGQGLSGMISSTEPAAQCMELDGVAAIQLYHPNFCGNIYESDIGFLRRSVTLCIQVLVPVSTVKSINLTSEILNPDAFSAPFLRLPESVHNSVRIPVIN
jgi:hypothetical protein